MQQINCHCDSIPLMKAHLSVTCMTFFTCLLTHYFFLFQFNEQADITVDGTHIDLRADESRLYWTPAPPKLDVAPSTVKEILFPEYQASYISPEIRDMASTQQDDYDDMEEEEEVEEIDVAQNERNSEISRYVFFYFKYFIVPDNTITLQRWDTGYNIIHKIVSSLVYYINMVQ